MVLLTLAFLCHQARLHYTRLPAMQMLKWSTLASVAYMVSSAFSFLPDWLCWHSHIFKSFPGLFWVVELSLRLISLAVPQVILWLYTNFVWLQIMAESFMFYVSLLSLCLFLWQLVLLAHDRLKAPGDAIGGQIVTELKTNKVLYNQLAMIHERLVSNVLKSIEHAEGNNARGVARKLLAVLCLSQNTETDANLNRRIQRILQSELLKDFLLEPSDNVCRPVCQSWLVCVKTRSFVREVLGSQTCHGNAILMVVVEFLEQHFLPAEQRAQLEAQAGVHAAD